MGESRTCNAVASVARAKEARSSRVGRRPVGGRRLGCQLVRRRRRRGRPPALRSDPCGGTVSRPGARRRHGPGSPLGTRGGPVGEEIAGFWPRRSLKPNPLCKRGPSRAVADRVGRRVLAPRPGDRRRAAPGASRGPSPRMALLQTEQRVLCPGPYDPPIRLADALSTSRLSAPAVGAA
jgi:hypothetical protein